MSHFLVVHLLMFYLIYKQTPVKVHMLGKIGSE